MAGRQTWFWNGSSWAFLTSTGPSGYRHALATDTARNRVVFFGDCCSSWAGGTYEWNGALWTQVASGGPERHDLGMVYDPGRQRLSFFGGIKYFSAVPTDRPNGDLWEWTGDGWEIRSMGGPAPRQGHAMAFDIAHDRIVVFGGVGEQLYGETWEWNPAAVGPRMVFWSQPPVRVFAAQGAPVSLSVTVSGNGPLSYQWRRWRVPLSNGPTISGVNTAMLTINPAGCTDDGLYDVVVTDQCGIGISDAATLDVLCPPEPCYADCDHSLALNVGDFTCFLSRFAAGAPEANCDGSTTPPVLNVNDFVCFQAAFAAGCKL
jgi:hypothetical protein